MRKISYYLFSHKALYTFVKVVLSIINPLKNDEPSLTGFANKTDQLFQDFDMALSRDYVNPFTIKINDADRQRDLRFLGLKNYLEACCYRKDNSWQEAAEQIKAVIERYGNDLYRTAQPEESAALLNLFTDLQNEPLKSACTTLENEPWLNELIEAQTYYEALVQQSHQQELTNDKTLMTTRTPLIAATKNLLKMVELQQQVQSSDALNAMVNQLNNLIASSMASARLSNALSDKAKVEN